jgi:hypothetical protein
MLNKKRIVILVSLFAIFAAGMAAGKSAGTLADRVSGRILLQVEDGGRAWYVNPVDKKRYSLGKPSEAFTVMRRLGLGITDKDLAEIPEAGNGSTLAPAAPAPAKEDSSERQPGASVSAGAEPIIITFNENGAAPNAISVKRNSKLTLIFKALPDSAEEGIGFLNAKGGFLAPIKPGETRTLTLTPDRSFSYWPHTPDHKTRHPYAIDIIAY